MRTSQWHSHHVVPLVWIP